MTTVIELPSEDVKGAAARRFDLRSEEGFRARLSAFGARLVDLAFPDGFDAVVGPSKAEEFKGPDTYAGPVCGRVANRISGATFKLDDVIYKLPANLGSEQLHGGEGGFDKFIWQAETTAVGVRFSLVSPDGDQGYPGTMSVTADYQLKGAVVALELVAATDKPTIVNLTNHAYWNLSGSPTVHDHTLAVSGGRYCVSKDALVTGEVRDVAGTAYDFQSPRLLGPPMDAVDGFDTNFCLDGARGELHHAATLSAAGRRMELWTTECGVQIYTARHFGPDSRGKAGLGLKRFAAVAMEPQAWPDAPNRAGFPSIVLRPGETYRHRMEWRFG